MNFTDRSSFQGSFIDQGVAVGPMVPGNVRVPLGERVLVGGAVRYQVIYAFWIRPLTARRRL